MILKNIKNNKRGFTLIEMLIAVLIFTLSLTALMSISSRGLKVAKEAEKQVIADYLAIEAVEIVRNIRDGAFLRNLGHTTWEMVFTGGDDIFGDDGCFNNDEDHACNFYFQPEQSQPLLGPCGDGCPIYLSKDKYYYFQTYKDKFPGAPVIRSDYSRSIVIKEVTPGQVFVLVKVSWDGGVVNYTENLFLWQ